MTHKDEFDHLVDEALSEYRDAEPLAGLESRVLWRLGQRPEKPKMLWFRRGIVVAGTAAIVFAVWFGTRGRAPAGEVPAREVAVRAGETRPSQPPSVPHTGRSGVTTSAAPHHRESPTHFANSASVAAAPGHFAGSMPEQFPAPAPLTENEQAFMAALNRHPGALQTPPDPESAVAIAKIEIKPLSNTDNPGESQ